MDETAYTYSISVDFPAHAVNPSKLAEEIDASVIAVGLVRIDTNNGQCHVRFVDALPPGDKTLLDGVVAVHDGTPPVYEPDEFGYWENDLPMTDVLSGKTASALIMSILTHRRELYNDVDNPIHLQGFKQILGAGGWAEEHASRIANCENIHAKAGWHNQQLKQQGWRRPTDILFYYGHLNSFNSLVNGWVNEKVAQDIAKYGIVVLGNGVQDPTHPDYANTQVIIPRVKALNPNCQIFGYVSANQSLSSFQAKVDQWETLQVHGVFLDEAGYDFGKTRVEFNDRVGYVHGKTHAKLAFANAWNTDHILGTTNDPSYPNSTWNSGLVASVLTESDWILLESLAVNTTAYSGNNGYASKSDWSARVSKAISLRAIFKVNFAAVGVVNDDNAAGQDLFNFTFISALMASLEAHGTSSVSYGSSTAQVKHWTRPGVSDIGVVWALSPSIQQDVGDADVYHRYAEYAKLTLDFSTGAQTSAITKS